MNAGTESDEEIDYPEDTRLGSEGVNSVRSLPMQQHLDASQTDPNLRSAIGALGDEMSIGGESGVDRAVSMDSMADEEVWVPDFASEYDYVILLPAKCTENGTYDRYTTIFQKFGLEVFCYRGVDDIVVVLIRAPVETLRKYADEINYKMRLDPAVLEQMCKEGLPQHQIAPIEINDDPELCSYHPYDHIYYKYSARVPEEMYYRDPHSVNGRMGHPFGVKERLRLIAMLLESRPRWGGENIKIQRYITKGDILGYFPLHQPEEMRHLSKVWRKSWVMPWNQPFFSIKEYYGEKFGLYFLFMGHYTRWLLWPAIVGLGFQIGNYLYYPTLRGAFNSKAMPFFSVFIVLWAVFMLEYWKRKESATALEWGTTGFEDSEVDSPEFRSKQMKSIITGKNIRYYPDKQRRATMRNTSLAVFGLICVVIGLVASIYIIRGVLIDHGVDAPNAQTCASFLNAVQIQLANAGYTLLAIELTKMENHRTCTAYEDNLTSKIFAFQFVNSYASFFYIAFFAYHVEDGGCGPNGCMYSLGKNLAIIFATRLCSGNFVELMWPFLVGQYNKCFKQCVYCHSVCNLCRKAENKKIFSRPEVEYSMAGYDTSTQVIGAYTNVAIQFGYQALFVSALPCSSFFAFISNIAEVKGDAWKLMHLYRRPVPVMTEDIGAFQQIFTIITGCSVLSNAALMKFTLTVLNDFDQNVQWWIFTGFCWVMFFIMLALFASIENESEDTKIQKKRTEYLGKKLIEHVADDDVSYTNVSVPDVKVQEYPRFGSQVHFSVGGGYVSDTESRSTSQRGSFANSSGNNYVSGQAGKVLSEIEPIEEASDIESIGNPLTAPLNPKSSKSE